MTNLYLMRGSPLELNLPVRVREATLDALNETTHPSALEPAIRYVEEYLRDHAHPTFIRQAISNANPARLNMITIFGIVNASIAIVLSVLLVLSSAGRYVRLSGAIFALFGSFAIINAKRGMCIVLLALGMLRNLEPWEVYATEQVRDNGAGKSITAIVGDLEQGIDRDQEVRIRVFVKEYDSRPVLSRIYEKVLFHHFPLRRRL